MKSGRHFKLLWKAFGHLYLYIGQHIYNMENEQFETLIFFGLHRRETTGRCNFKADT